MSTLLKDLYSEDFINNFGKLLKQVAPKTDEKKFHADIFNPGWMEMELKDRMRHIAITLNDYLNKDYKIACKQIIQMINDVEQNMFTTSGFEFLFFPEYIERYGIDDYDTSMKTMERVTQFTSCEFSIRPFIIKYPKAIKDMTKWSLSKNKHIRRLASEGSRSRLPWAMALPEYKKDPSPLLQILENLKNDPSEYVRRSVANNLNDIAKDNPELVLEISEKWIGKTKETDKLIKHALRTLLKQGNSKALELIGYGNPKNLEIKNLSLTTSKIKVGEYLHFEFDVINTAKKAVNTRMEYSIYFLLGNGKQSRKVFKISEPILAQESTNHVMRKQSFKPITTRRYYEGAHAIGIIVNGEEKAKMEFELIFK